MFTDPTEPLSSLLCLSILFRWYFYHFLKRTIYYSYSEICFYEVWFYYLIQMSLLLKMAGKGVAGSCLEISLGVAGHNAQIWYPVWFISPSPPFDILVPVQNREKKTVAVVRSPAVTWRQLSRSLKNVQMWCKQEAQHTQDNKSSFWTPFFQT